MPTVDRSAMVRHTDRQMFDLVNDFERYPEFLPNCRQAHTVEQGERHLIGELTLGKGGIEQTFRTRNDLIFYDRINLSLASGPFRRFEGYWKFSALDESSCRVELHLEFDFSSRLLGMAFGRLFNQIAGQLVNAFIKRADEVYGR